MGKSKDVTRPEQLPHPEDHAFLRAKDDTNHPDDLQLLCKACNARKGTLSQEGFAAKLKVQGIRAT